MSLTGLELTPVGIVENHPNHNDYPQFQVLTAIHFIGTLISDRDKMKDEIKALCAELCSVKALVEELRKQRG